MAIAFPTGPLIDPSSGLASAWRYFFMALRGDVTALQDGLVATLASPGFQQLPSGLIRNWGLGITVAGGGVAVGYAKPFLTAVLSFQATITGGSGPTPLTIISGPPALNFCNVWCANSTTGAAAVGVGFYWEALGN
jgi:hypothetical protein